MSHTCPHCGKPVNPAQMLGSVKSPKKEAASKANGERLRRMYANARKLEESPHAPVPLFANCYAQEPPAPSPIPLSDTPPNPTTLEGKKAAAFAALAGRGKVAELLEPDLHDVPCAPFDFNHEGTPHRVKQIGSQLKLIALGDFGEYVLRTITQDEMSQFWEARIK